MSDKEIMIHPFTRVACTVQRLNPGETITVGDVYRSATLMEDRSDIGRWFAVTETMHGFPVGPTCNVNFMRLTPIVYDTKKVS